MSIITHISLKAAMLLLMTAALRSAYAEPVPKYEMRAAWLATVYGIDWPAERGTSAAIGQRQQEQLYSMLTRLHRAGINAVFFQVRPLADALYESSLEPWSEFVSGKRGEKPSFDPLGFCIETCHELGMECHAWINPLRVGKVIPDTNLDRKHASMWMTNRVGRSSSTIFNPALNETRSHLCSVCLEIAEKYDIDGIVFDDYFYNPEFIPEDKRAADWNLYKAVNNGLAMGDWRRNNINTIISDVYHTIKSVKNGKIRFGVSPQGIAGGNGVHCDAGVPLTEDYGIITSDSQYSKIYSDPVMWLREGIVDYISPQIYWETGNPKHPYEGLCRWWNDVAELFGRHCFVSQSLPKFATNGLQSSYRESLMQARANRSASFNYAPGCVFYSAAYLAGGKAPGLDRVLADSLFSSPALIPPMTWQTSARPIMLTTLQIEGNTLTWNRTDDERFIIYAVPRDINPDDALADDADGLSPRFIISVTYDNHYNLPDGIIDKCRIAVAPYDRYGNEWPPCFLDR